MVDGSEDRGRQPACRPCAARRRCSRDRRRSIGPHPDAPDQTKAVSFKAIEDSDLIGEEIETGIATVEGADIIMDEDTALAESVEAEQIHAQVSTGESNTRIWDRRAQDHRHGAIMAIFSVYCIWHDPVQHGASRG